MEKTKLTLVTIEYPPQTGGIARYLGNLVEASAGEINVLDVRPFFGKMWPKWLPVIGKIQSLKDSTECVLVSHVLPIGTAAWIAHLFGGPEYLVLFHGTDLRHADTLWKRWLLKRICGSACALISNSEATKKELFRLTSKESVVITPGVEVKALLSRDEARAKLGISAQTKLILSIARLVPRKGIDVAIEAIARLTESGSGFQQVDGVSKIGFVQSIPVGAGSPRPSFGLMNGIRYVVIGSGPDEKRLKQLSENNGVNVEWKSAVSDDEKWLWLAAADLFLLPGREEKKDVEGFGIVYLEAALAGVPSVAGKSGGVAEAVIDGETGVLVNPNSVEEVSSVIEKLLKDDVLRKRMGEVAQERVKKEFRWQDRWEALSVLLGGIASAPAELARHRNRVNSFYGLAQTVLGASAIPPAEPADVSVVIPCYNHAKELKKTLEALAKQTLLPKEIVVVDDFSDDQPQKVVDSFNINTEKKNLQLSVGYLRLRHRHGAPYARNEGSRLTSSEYILFLDADTELVPDALETFVQALEAHPECSFSYSNFLWGAKLFKGRPFDVGELRKVNYITTASLIRRSAFPGFDESLKKFQDWDLWLTMAEKGLKGVWIDKTLFRVAPRKTGISQWLPRIAYQIPWSKLGWTPKEVASYRRAEAIIRKKHGL